MTKAAVRPFVFVEVGYDHIRGEQLQSKYLFSTGPVYKDGKVLDGMDRQGIDGLLQQFGNGDMRPSRLFEELNAGRGSGFGRLEKSLFLDHLTITRGKRTETKRYAIDFGDRRSEFVRQNGYPKENLLLNGSRFKADGGRMIVVPADVFALQYNFGCSFHDVAYDPEDVDPETGFIAKTNPRGKHPALLHPGFHPVTLRNGRVSCFNYISHSGNGVRPVIDV
jgi:hypothetical protein